MHNTLVKHSLHNKLSCLFLLLVVLLAPSRVSALGTIVINGQFLDWAGQTSISDTIGDYSHSSLDITSFSFATNPDDPTAYFMIERFLTATQPVGYLLYIDTNNGNYTETVDRIIDVRYQAKTTNSDVDIELKNGQGTTLAKIANGTNWGESQLAGGRKVEWGVTFAQLGISAGQAMRMYVTSKPGNTPGSSACDTTAEVQWSPADALGLPLLIGILLMGAGLMAHRRRKLA